MRRVLCSVKKYWISIRCRGHTHARCHRLGPLFAAAKNDRMASASRSEKRLMRAGPIGDKIRPLAHTLWHSGSAFYSRASPIYWKKVDTGESAQRGTSQTEARNAKLFETAGWWEPSRQEKPAAYVCVRAWRQIPFVRRQIKDEARHSLEWKSGLALWLLGQVAGWMAEMGGHACNFLLSSLFWSKSWAFNFAEELKSSQSGR